MNPDKLKALLERNKKGLAIAGAGAVAAVAFARSRGGKSTPDAAAAADPTTSMAAAGASTSRYPSAYTAGSYDSTGSDVYQAIQPQLEDLQEMYAQQNKKTPVPVDPGFYGRAGGTGIYQVDAEGNRDHLGMEEYLALGAPAYKAVARDDSFWTRTTAVGADNGTWN